ncbi:hypothetical protein GS502_10690 [Rhodococcus hoagii]|nr:hypothetical protein [Prescottella equi]MBM4469783.1 hypothetical protein [Prescottella equi]
MLTDAGEPITLETVEADASRWGVRLSWTEAWFDRQIGAEVAEDEIDWDTHDNPDLEAEDGLIHMNSIETCRVWDREFHLLDPGNLEGSGLQLSDVAKVMVARRAGRAAAVPATAEEAAAQIEAEREERRRVRELNKRAEAANTVRRTFLRTLLGRTKLPANAAVWMAVTLASDPHLLAEYHASDCLGELLGIKDYRLSNNAARDLAVNASDSRAQVITFALVIAAMEARMVKDAWRTRPEAQPPTSNSSPRTATNCRTSRRRSPRTSSPRPSASTRPPREGPAPHGAGLRPVCCTLKRTRRGHDWRGALRSGSRTRRLGRRHARRSRSDERRRARRSNRRPGRSRATLPHRRERRARQVPRARQVGMHHRPGEQKQAGTW